MRDFDFTTRASVLLTNKKFMLDEIVSREMLQKIFLEQKSQITEGQIFKKIFQVLNVSFSIIILFLKSAKTKFCYYTAVFKFD